MYYYYIRKFTNYDKLRNLVRNIFRYFSNTPFYTMFTSLNSVVKFSNIKQNELLSMQWKLDKAVCYLVSAIINICYYIICYIVYWQSIIKLNICCFPKIFILNNNIVYFYIKEQFYSSTVWHFSERIFIR